MKSFLKLHLLLIVIALFGSCKTVTIKNPTRTVKANEGGTIIIEKGMASMIDAEHSERRCQVLHRSAPIGSFFRVTNLSNGKRVVVAVIGRLPKNTAKNVIIKLSKRAYDQLDAKRITPVEIDYDNNSFYFAPHPKSKGKVKIEYNNNLSIYDERYYTKTDVNTVMVFEKGMASMIDVGQDSQKYEALHRTAPVRSFVRIKNLNNDKIVVVVVIGRLPKNTAKNVIIKLSKRAYDQLDAKRITPVEIDYDNNLSTYEERYYTKWQAKVKKKKKLPPLSVSKKKNSQSTSEIIRPAMVINNPTRTTKTEKNKVMVFEKGMASMIDVGQDSQKYEALHRTAPKGTFITIINLSNRKLVVATVIGRLPKNTAKNVIIKLSKRTYDQLDAKGTTPVEIDYDLEKK